MSRAFTKEGDGWADPSYRINLPPRDDPAFELAVAEALLEAAREGKTGSAEAATGYYWGDRKLHPQVQRILETAREKGDKHLVQLAQRFLL